MKDEQLIQDFITYWLLFYADINEKRGVSSVSFENFEQVLIRLKELISKNNSVPIEVAGIFIDMYSSLESLSTLYQDEDKQEIMEAADYLASLARSACEK